MPTLTGSYVHGDGTARVGSLRFAPSVAIAGDDQIVLPAPLSVELDTAGAFSVSLVGTDDPAYSPSGWVWQVTEVLDGGRSWAFELEADADISDLVPVAVPESYAAFVMVGDEITASLTSGAATSGHVPTADGAGGIDWAAQAGGGGGAVDSVNGETGVVVLDAADVGAAAASHTHALTDVTDAGGAAALDVGTTAGTVAAGDDSRIVGAVQGSLVDAKGDLLVATADNTVTRLAVGATDGHVLTVDAASTPGVKWAAAAGGGAITRAIRSTSAYTMFSGIPQGTSTLTALPDRQQGAPFVVDKAVSITKVECMVNVAATAVTPRLAIYSVAEPWPESGTITGSLVADFGTIDATSQGSKVITLGSPLTLTPGLYFAMIAMSTGTTAPTFGVAFLVFPSLHLAGLSVVSNNWRYGYGLSPILSGGNTAVSGGFPSSLDVTAAASGPGPAATGSPMPMMFEWSYA